MSNFKDPNAFADPEDTKIIADAKKIIPDPVPYNYTEVSNPSRSSQRWI
jgi:multifunctional beta-oxidation protein